MSVPIVLPNGCLCVYGFGYNPKPTGIMPSTLNFVYGDVYQIWFGGSPFFNIGSQVIWDKKDQVCQLTYSGNPYTIVPARLVIKID